MNHFIHHPFKQLAVTISCILFTIQSLSAQIITNKVRVEETNNVTSISGKVGIGTNTPGDYQFALHAGDSEYALINLSNNANLNKGLQIGNVTRLSNDTEWWNWEAGYFRVGTNNVERLRITEGGNLGIGIITPSATIDVVRGTANGGTAQFRGTNRTSHFNYSTDEDTYIRGGKPSSNVLINDNGGNVGIGTTNPGSYKLNVKGSTYINGSMRFRTVAHDGENHLSHLQFPLATDGFYIETRQLNPDQTEVLFRLRDNITGDYFKIWFDDYRGETYDRYPLMVAGDKVLLASDGGNVGVGLTSPTYRLHVNGSVKGTTLHTDTRSWSDFVFDTDYELKPLEEVEQYIKENKHLPDVPSESEVIEKGINVAEMDAVLLQKIEELTLYILDQDERLKQLKNKNMELNDKVDALITMLRAR